MFTVELYAGIRRAVMVDGLSRREAAKRFGVHRNTITKMLQFSVPPGYRRGERPASKKLGPCMAWIDAILEGDRSVHKKQRHTAHRIFERLRDEQGCNIVDPSTINAGRPSSLSVGPGRWNRPEQSYYIQKGPLAFASTYERLAGGTSRHWLGTCPRFVPNDFRMTSGHQKSRDWAARAVGWPITANGP